MKAYPLVMIGIIIASGIVATISCYGYYYTYEHVKKVIQEVSQKPEGGNATSVKMPPSYSPDVVIYQEQQAPQNYGKAITVLISILFAFLVAFLIIKFGTKAFKVLLFISASFALIYTLHGISFRHLPFWMEASAAVILSAFFVFWKNYKYRDVVGILFSGGIAALLGTMLYPYIWAPILAAFAIYDFLAVRSGKMVNLAENAIREDIPLLIVIKAEGEEHYIGFGDLVFPFILTTSLLRYVGLMPAILSWTGIGIAMALLPIIVENRGPQPGLIYLIPGSMLGLIWYLLAF